MNIAIGSMNIIHIKIKVFLDDKDYCEVKPQSF